MNERMTGSDAFLWHMEDDENPLQAQGRLGAGAEGHPDELGEGHHLADLAGVLDEAVEPLSKADELRFSEV